MAAIIKAGEVRTTELGTKNSAFNFEDLTAEAEKYLQKVRQEAVQIVQKAEQQSEEIRNKAMEQGRRAAIANAEKHIQEKIVEQMKTAMPALRQVIAELQNSREIWVRQWEKNIVRFCTAVAERIVRRELSEKPEISIDLIKEGLQMAAGGGKIKLHLNPEDHLALEQQINHSIKLMANMTTVEVLADPAISSGGCRLDTEFGSIDQQIESQLKRVEEELT